MPMTAIPRMPLPPPEFRAPPPSPVSGWPEAADEDDELAGFLTRSGSFRVPRLVLPERISRRAERRLPEFDMGRLSSPEGGEAMRSAAASIGCFQIVNHGIPVDLIAAAGDAARGAFGLAAAGKDVELPPPPPAEGAEEELWWAPRRECEMAGMCPRGFEDFSDKMDQLWVELERTASKVEQILLDAVAKTTSPAPHWNGVPVLPRTSALCFRKSGYGQCTSNVGQFGSLEHDVLRMLIKSSTCSNALALHFNWGASSFHVYSKTGRVAFRVEEGALVLTIGNQIQVRSGGLYKHVIGKPVFSNGLHQDAISMQFLYSRPFSSNVATNAVTRDPCTSDNDGMKTISISGQLRIAACLILLWHVISYILA